MSNKIVESTTMTTTGNRNMMMETCLFISTSLVGLILMCLSLFIVTMDESRTNLFDDTLIQFNESQFHSITQTFFAVAIIATVDVLYDIKEAFKDSLKSKLWCMRFGLSLVYLATASLYFLLHSMPFTPAPTFQFVSTASTLVTSSLYILIILTTSPSTALSATSVALAFMQTLNSVFTFHNFLNPDNNDSSHSFLVENVVMYLNLVALLAYIGICAYNMYVGSVGSSKAKVGSTLIYITSLILPFVPVRAVFPTDSSLCASDKTQYLWRVYAACASTALLLVAARVDHMGDVESQEQLLEVKKGQAAFMSHELRTPLNAILMGLQMALEQTSAQSSNTVELARRQVLVETEVACDAAVDILNEFLLFDKLENGALALFKESVSILDLVRSSVQMFALQMRAKEISFTVENNGALLEDWQSEKTMDFVSLISHPVFMGSLICPPDELDDLLSSQSLYAKDCIQVDKSKVIRVLRNVLSNAIKFTPHTGNISLNMRFECSALQETLKASSSTGSIFSLQRWTSSKKLAEVPRCISAKGLELGTVARPTTLTTPARTRKSMTTFNEGIRGSSNQFEGDYKKLMSSTFPSFPTISKQKSGADFLSVTAPAALCVPELNTRNKKVTDQQSVTSVDGWLVLELTDDGAGISSENQKKLFKEVIQFHPEKLQGGGGSGLGTMISKGIVELHGGNISVYSEGEGFGTTLTVRLPMTRRYDEVVVTSVGDLPLTETKPTHITSESSNRIHYGSDKKESVKLHPPQQTVEDNDTDTSLITPRLVMKPMSTESYTFSPFSEWSAPRGVAVHESKHRGQLRHSTSDVTIATPQTATTVHYCSALSNSSDDSAEKQGLNIEARNQGRYDCTPENLSDSDGPDSDKNLDQVTGESTPTTTTIATQRSLLDSKGSQLDKQTPCLLVLVVDDSALTRKMMVRLLDRRGHTSVEAADGLSALRMIQDSLAPGASKGYEPFDLVLIDNMMPVMNGVDATKEMRAVGFTGSIFGISGSVLDADVKAFRKAGVNLVLTKPIDMKLFQNGLACVISDKHNALVSTA